MRLCDMNMYMYIRYAVKYGFEAPTNLHRKI